MNDQSKTEETLRPNDRPSSGAQESGAGYGNAQGGIEAQEQRHAQDGADAHDGDPEQADQAVQRSETIDAEDMAANDRLIDNGA